MTKQELEDAYFHEFLVWCATAPTESGSSDLIFWLDHNQPTSENFWEYMVRNRRGVV